MKEQKIMKLFIPIYLEILCYMLAGVVDTLMLSSVGDAAVGAVGTANTYMGMFIIMFSIISSGMIAVMTQYIGAKQEGVAYQARQLGLAFNAILGSGMSILLLTQSSKILGIVGVADTLMDYATTYLTIIGAGCILNAIIPIYSSYLRAFGHTKEPLIATISGNILNLILNAFFLYLFKWGIAGIATATVISRVLNLVILIVSAKRKIHAQEDLNRKSNKEIFKQIIKIGLPSAFETALYNLAMTFIIRFLNQMDVDGINVTARSYATQITNFSYCVGAALAQANAIMTGWNIGAGEFKACDIGTKRAAIIGIAVAVLLEGSLALSSAFLMKLFTDNPIMISLVRKILLIDIVLEIGRVTNLVFGNALKTSGDAIFPSIIAAIFMYLCAVGGTYYFGIHLKMFVVGAYIGLASDECIRAVCMFLRWQTGIWKTKRLIN